MQNAAALEALRAKLRESEEEQKRLQMLIEQAEEQPEDVGGPDCETPRGEPLCQEVGGPDCETPRAEPRSEKKASFAEEVDGPHCITPEITPRAESQSEKTLIACVPPSNTAKSMSFQSMQAFPKARAVARAEQKMKIDLDLDSPVLDEMGMLQYREALSSVEELLYAAAQHVVGPHSEAMVEAEVIGACAFGTVSTTDTIDVLCKVSQISSQELFEVLRQMLDADPSASCVREHPEVVTGSLLSGLCFSYAKVPFRMFLAKVPWDESDEETFQSLNGCLLVRSLNEIISENSSFPQALRLVKFWAQRRGIYGKGCGYPDGLTWSICLARVCQMYPKANAAELVLRFFKVYCSWDWQTAVSLKPIDGFGSVESHPVEEGKIAVLTPGGCPINTAGHVNKSALPVLQEELQRAYKLCKRVTQGKASWSDVYALPSIANKNKHYMRLEFAAQTKEALDLLVEWGEVCLPTLLTTIEKTLPNIQARPWSHRMMVTTDNENNAFACSMFIGLRFNKGVQQQVDMRIPVVSFLEMLDKWPCKEHFAGQYDTTLQHLRRHELQQWWERHAPRVSLEQISDSQSDENGSMEQKQLCCPVLSDSQSDENADGDDSQGRRIRFTFPRWSDTIDEDGSCVECY